VILPLAAPAVAAGAILVFIIALNELTVSALLWSAGHETLGVVVFSLEQGGDSTLAAALSVLVAAATVALMGLASLIARRLPRGVLPWQ
jgi:iron(III) transport system permease protein